MGCVDEVVVIYITWAVWIKWWLFTWAVWMKWWLVYIMKAVWIKWWWFTLRGLYG